MHELSHEFTSRKISPWGGIKYFHQTYQRSGLKEALERTTFPGGGSNRAYSAVDIVEGFMVSVVLGSRRLAHSGMLRTDEVVREIFDWKKGMASQSTFCRFFKRFDLKSNDEIFTSLMRQWWDNMHVKRLTIDVDSTVITRYGNQEGAEIGYNPQKQGRPSHHPLIAFNAELQMVVNAWMRNGNTSSGTQMDCFIDQLLEILPANRIGLLRADSGFYSGAIMYELERARIDYIIKAKMTSALRQTILEQTNWFSNEQVWKGCYYCEFEYQSSEWDKARRIVVVARPKERQDNHQKSLFEEVNWQKNYDFHAYVTSSKLSCPEVHRQYNQRADCENRIKELKYDYAIDGFAMNSFAGTEAAFRMVMLAYNVMSLFKQKVMLGPVRHRLGTIKFQCIAIGSYLITKGQNKKMKLAAEGKRRHFLEHLFDNVERLSPPFQFSNA
jgi:hypothetical protein